MYLCSLWYHYPYQHASFSKDSINICQGEECMNDLKKQSIFGVLKTSGTRWDMIEGTLDLVG